MLLLSPGRMITVGRLPEAVYGAPAADGQVPSADQHLQAAAAAGRPLRGRGSPRARASPDRSEAHRVDRNGAASCDFTSRTVGGHVEGKRAGYHLHLESGGLQDLRRLLHRVAYHVRHTD
jgi:hypothetical protein